MRKVQTFENDVVHIYTRGVRKMRLFHDKDDYFRMIFYLLFFQYPCNTHKINYISSRVKLFLENGNFVAPQSIKKDNSKVVELLSFCLMKNHVHISSKQYVEGGFAVYMRRVQGAYAHYYNHKYNMQGHVFENTYKLRKIDCISSFIRNTAYIHRNPYIYSHQPYSTTLVMKDISNYPFSSLIDLLKDNRWGICFDFDKFLTEVELTKEEYMAYLKIYLHNISSP